MKMPLLLAIFNRFMLMKIHFKTNTLILRLLSQRRNVTIAAGIIVIFAFFINIYAADTHTLSNQEVLLEQKMQTIVNNDRIRYHLPALSVSIKLPGENFTRNYVSGYDSLANKNKITADSLFQIGSITKTFTATMILKLAEANKLSLDDDLGKWLPQYPRWQKITLRNLLTNTSGVYNYTSGKSFDEQLRKKPNKFFSTNELADIAYLHTDLFKPGHQYNYTNTDYVLLGLIIEKSTNKSLQQVFKQYLYEHHLNNTFYSPLGYPKDTISRMAHGYNRDGTFKFNKDITLFSMSFGQSAGAMISTPSDLINWLNQLFTGKIIVDKSLAEMLSVTSETNGEIIDLQNFLKQKTAIKKPFVEIGTGLGIGLVYFPNYGVTWVHAGGTLGYESFYTYNPCNGIYLVLLYNIKPKQQLIYTKIARDLFSVISQSEFVSKRVTTYQHNSTLPGYCQNIIQ